MSASIAKPNDLGREIGRYTAGFVQTWGAVAFGVFCLLLAPIAFFGLSAMWSGFGAGMDEAIKETPFLNYLPAIVGGVVALVGLISFYGAWRDWSISVALYDQGLEYADRQGLKHRKWSDLANVTHFVTRHTIYGIIPTGTTHVFRFVDKDGVMFQIDGRFGNYNDLCDKLTRIVKPG